MVEVAENGAGVASVLSERRGSPSVPVCVNCQVGQDGTSETRPEIDPLPSIMLQSPQGHDRSDM